MNKAVTAIVIVTVLSVVIIVAWLLILHSKKISTHTKLLVTSAVIISPIPPFP